ncbi:putative Zinc finger, RING-type [Helianthus annuus]|nr:putative Zinc finger, RING-type [Helianthus annuus]
MQRGKAQCVAPSPPLPPPPPPQPKEATFSCPVCLGPLVEEVATKCGHIFCKACITAATNAQHKCPTCRQQLTNRDFIRVYLPAATK